MILTELKNLLGKTANLTFRIVSDQLRMMVLVRNVLFFENSELLILICKQKSYNVSGDNLTNATTNI